MPLRVTGGRWQFCPFFSLFPYPASSWQKGQAKESALAEPRGGETAPSSTAIWMSQTMPKVYRASQQITDLDAAPSTPRRARIAGAIHEFLATGPATDWNWSAVSAVSAASRSSTHTHARIHSCTTPALVLRTISISGSVCLSTEATGRVRARGR